MFTFLICIVVLIAGYFIYGAYVEKVFEADSNAITPAKSKADGVDFIELHWSKAFLIQFLNIAGTGPIFGAVAGALWGPAAFIWIVFGCIFGGMVHDYLSGMLSLRHGGASITEIVGEYLGPHVKKLFILLCMLLLILVGAVFITSPADILTNLTGVSKSLWLGIIILYYLIATVLPVDKVIGKIYPIFGAALLIMAVGIFGGMFATGKIFEIPEFTFKNLHPQGTAVFPFLFLSIACGAISGFHSTQSPMMARCIRSEKEGKKVFAGSMVTEGVVALIWAAIAMCYFGGTQGLAAAGPAPVVVNKVSMEMLGKIGGALALLGVVACPITTGDTAFRSARLIIADMFKIKQISLASRFYIAIPLFICGVWLTFVDFTILWRYFAWANQTISIFPLWVGANYLYKRSKNYFIAMVPAMFMTVVTLTYILQAKEGLGFPMTVSYYIAFSLMAIFTIIFYVTNVRHNKK